MLSGNMTQTIEYLFIDGAYLREMLAGFSRAFFQNQEMQLDYQALAGRFQKIFYYDCIAPKKSGELQADYELRIGNQRRHFDKIRFVDRWHVFEGVTYGQGGRVRQKQIDVKIAVDMLMHSQRRNMQKATLLTGDLDFKPVVDALILDGMFVTIWYEHSTAANELLLSADARNPLSVYQVYEWTSTEFKKKFALPKRWSDKSVVQGQLMENGINENGEIEARLWKADDNYVIETQSLVNEGYRNYMKWRDVEYLKLVYEATQGKVNWKPG